MFPTCPSLRLQGGPLKNPLYECSPKETPLKRGVFQWAKVAPPQFPAGPFPPKAHRKPPNSRVIGTLYKYHWCLGYVYFSGGNSPFALPLGLTMVFIGSGRAPQRAKFVVRARRARTMPAGPPGGAPPHKGRAPNPPPQRVRIGGISGRVDNSATGYKTCVSRK